MWSNFAKYGNPTPNEELNVVWESTNSNNLKFLDIGTDLVMSDHPEKDRMDLWNEIYRASHGTRDYLM